MIPLPIPPTPGKNLVPGVPVMGHMSKSGHWHPGNIRTCGRCEDKR